MTTSDKVRRAYYVWQDNQNLWWVDRLNDYRNADVPQIDGYTTSACYSSKEAAETALTAAVRMMGV